MPSKPTIDGKKYIQLTDHILLEYTYVVDWASEQQQLPNDLIALEDGVRVGTYGRGDTQRYGILTNGYLNEPYFVNSVMCSGETENNVGTTVLPINKASNRWVSTSEKNGDNYYSAYDPKWGDIAVGEGDILVDSTEYIVYDIVRVYFQGGYNSEYEGFVFNVFGKNSNGFYYNLANKLFRNTDSYSICPTPVWYADKVYTNYVEFRVPSIAQLSCKTQTASVTESWGAGYDPLNPPADTLPYRLTRGQGLYDNPSIGFDLHGVDGTETQNGFTVYRTVPLISTLFPNREMNDSIVASVREDADDGDYIKLCVYYEKDLNNARREPFSMYDYLSTFGNTFTLIHQVSVTESYADGNNVVTESQLPVTYIQTWENLYEMKENYQDRHQDPTIVYRPILYHTESLVGATVTYTVRIANNRDNTSVIKTSTYDIPNPRRYGRNLVGLNMSNATTVHVYNRIEQTKNVVMNTTTNPIGPISDQQSVIKVNKFVTSSFIDRRNIKVRVSPVKIDNVE